MMWWAAIDAPGVPGGRPGRRSEAENPAADEQAIRRVADGDPDALAVLYDRHSGGVFSLVLRILEDQADSEDVVQDVFAQAWRQAPRYDSSRGTVAAWLLTIARSRAIDRLRARRAKPDSARFGDQRLFDLPDLSAGQEKLVMTSQQIAAVRAALNRLPLLQRIAIELAYYEGLTQNEIAERLEQPLGTVKTRIRLGLLKLRDALAEKSR
ncbi:MAG: sigma-70 family RNA polymerase sigma factor [Acidobacteria bacterium]|nr:sigma-70 family RNA polymerase sigma factor [Acidobacteriota bacterium]